MLKEEENTNEPTISKNLMLAVTFKPRGTTWVLPEDTIMVCMMKQLKRTNQVSNIVFANAEILKPYEEYKALLETGSRKRTFPKPEGVGELVHLALVETYRSAVCKTKHSMKKRSPMDLTCYDRYTIEKTDSTEATDLPELLTWTLSNARLREKVPREVARVQTPEQVARLLSAEEMEDIQEKFAERYGHLGGRVSIGF